MKYIFLVKSNFLRWLSLTLFRIRMNPKWFGSLGPNPHWGKQLDLDPDPHWVNGWIRIRIETNADPQHRFRNRIVF
jgi:hypothetical protein